MNIDSIPVCGSGSDNPLILFIGEYPSYADAIEGEAFMDRPGYNFRRLIALSLIGEGEVRYCYTLNKIEDRKNPDLHLHYIISEIKECKPSVIVTLGLLPTRLLLEINKSAKLMDYVEKEFIKNGIVIYPYYSINYILQCGKRMEQRTIQFLKRIYAELVV